MNTVSMLIKPASGRCNLRCRYCFYEDVSEHRQDHDLGLMDEDTAALDDPPGHGRSRVPGELRLPGGRTHGPGAAPSSSALWSWSGSTCGLG